LRLRVPSRIIFQPRPLLRTSAAASLFVLGVLALVSVSPTAQIPSAVVGRIQGDSILVKTATRSGLETDAGPTVVASGSDVTVPSGHALLSLDGGGEISICGPAHFTVFKSGEALTLAVDYGRVHPSLDSPQPLMIYTPMIVATPISIAGGPREMTLGLNQTGQMCIVAATGAMRVEQQLSGQSLIVPQSGAVSLQGGQIDSIADATSCSCDFPHNRMGSPLPSPSSIQEISVLSRPVVPEPRLPEAVPPPPPPVEEPVYTVLMPPLSFDATAPAPPPDPSPETIMLVREMRVRPAAVFHGHVEPEPMEASLIPVPHAPPAATTAESAEDDRPPDSRPGLVKRVLNFFRRVIGGGPCAGAGCGG
jgi:hypothetical protein